MPNIWCHILLGNEFVRNLPDDVKKDIYGGPCHSVFKMGALGPDFFLFDNWKHCYVNSRHEVSSYLHRNRCKDALMYAVNQVKKDKDRGLPWWTQAIYTLGTVSHFVADASIHPMVYKIVPKSIAYRNYHIKLEVEMDVYMAESLGIGAERIIANPAASLVMPNNASHEICQYYYDLVNDFYKGELRPITAEQILRSLKSYLAAFEFLRTQDSMYNLSRGIACLTFGKVRLDWFWHPDQVSEDVKKHFDAQQFWQLCHNAMDIGENVLPMIWQYWHGADNLPEIRAMLPKTNYLGDYEA